MRPGAGHPRGERAAADRATGAQRLRSAYLRFWLEVSERLRWSRGERRETPCGELRGIDAPRRARIAALAAGFGIACERALSQPTVLDNYAYLDLLDRTFRALAVAVPRAGRVQDAGSAGFRYAAALDAFFNPASLVGVEVEGYRLLRDGRSRIDHARGYIAPFPRARYVVADYAAFDEPADVVTMFYPFVTVAPLLAWRLPLRVFAPGAWFARAAGNLAPGGLLIVVSHGESEAAIATEHCRAQGLVALGEFRDDEPLQPRPLPSVVTLWRRPEDMGAQP